MCIGTVKGDLHDIGKNLVKMMMEGKGLEVVDLGTDVAPETFIQTAKEQNCQVICCSTLLVATMGVMEEVVKAAEAAGIRDSVKIMVGGAPVTEDFCRQIGADAYTPDAVTAAELAVQFCARPDCAGQPPSSKGGRALLGAEQGIGCRVRRTHRRKWKETQACRCLRAERLRGR